MDAEPAAEPSSWYEYIEQELELLYQQAGPDLLEAMIASRCIEQPGFADTAERRQQELAAVGVKRLGSITKAGYWERIALRALVLLKIPRASWQQLIDEAAEREAKAREAVRRNLKKGPGGPYREVDLSQLTI